MSLKVNGLRTRQTAMVCMYIKMEQDMKENGKMIFNTVKEKKFGQIIQCMKVIIMKARNMAKDSIFGKMGRVTTVIGMKIE